jgi:hypothetical protein
VDYRHTLLTLIICTVGVIFVLLWIRRDQQARVRIPTDASEDSFDR